MIAPSNEPKKTVAKRSIPIGRFAAWGLVGVLAVAVVFIVAISTGTHDQEEYKKSDKKPSVIATVEPSKATSPKEAAEVEKPASQRPQKVGEVRDGYVLLPNGKRHKRKGLKEIKVSEWNNKSRYQIFDSFTDNEFATLLTIKPGEMLIGGGVFPKDYEARFLKSLESPIIVSKDDPEDIQEVKRAVIQTRIELKQALDRGEDIREYVKAAYDDAQKLAAYKDVITDELKKLRNQPNLSEEDIDDFVEAANRMLDSKGIAPLKIGPLTKWRLMNLRK